MKITLDEVRRIAGLAHLAFPDEDLERLRGQLDHILSYMETLAELDTEGVEPFTGPEPMERESLRPDEPGPTLTPREALSNAPEQGQQHFKVPKVIP